MSYTSPHNGARPMSGPHFKCCKPNTQISCEAYRQSFIGLTSETKAFFSGPGWSFRHDGGRKSIMRPPQGYGRSVHCSCRPITSPHEIGISVLSVIAYYSEPSREIPYGTLVAQGVPLGAAW